MIVSKEIRFNPQSEIGKELCISYVNEEGGIDFFRYPIPKSEWFEWTVTDERNIEKEYAIDRDTGELILDENGQPIMKEWRTFDGQPVRKNELNEKSMRLSKYRISEILNSFGSRISKIFEMHKPKLCFCDIETLVTEDSGFPDAESARQPITTISVTHFPHTIIWATKPLPQEDIDWIQDQIETHSERHATKHDKKDITKGYKFQFRCFPTEREMMIDFLKYIGNFTAIAGWNFLNYDWKYIYNRCMLLGIDIDGISPTHRSETFKLQPRSGGQQINLKLPLHKIIFDYMLIVKTWDMTIEHAENYTLDYIADRVLSIKKVNHEWGFAEFYRNHFRDYVYYNAIDTILIEQMDKVIETASIWYMLASILRIDLNSAYSTITPAETVMCNFIYSDYKVIPDKGGKEGEEKTEKYAGAFVWPTAPSIDQMVMGLDFASLYPTIMRQFGISPEVYLKQVDPMTYVPADDEIVTCSGAVYRKDPKAIIPAILTEYFGLRKAAKNNKKQAESELEYYKEILHRRKAAAERMAVA